MRVFLAVYKLPTEERTERVDAACGDDSELRAILERLLANHDAPPRALRAVERVGDAAALNNPETIGPYRIAGVLGRGGMGVVYRAEQDKPSRTVALKVLVPDAVGPGALKRFAREIEILGALHHPGIAQVYAAGTFENSLGVQPYFAMELLEGTSITCYAEQHALSPRERCELVARVCDAVQHAHGHGVVHRDIKPANIIVCEPERGVAVPKVLDFGIARSTDSDVALSTLQTQTGQLVGTLPYMSPEQVQGLTDLDCRTDVYSLGVVLYEMLAGHLPHDVQGKPLTEIARLLTDSDVTLLGRLDRRYRGDLETITDKALAKDRDRRYPSAAALAEDLRRYLRDEPVVARPQSTWYQIRKFTRRNRTLAGGVAFSFLILVIGVAISLSLMLDARRSARESQFRLYVSQIKTAAAIAGEDPVAARDALMTAPLEHRSWEWDYFRARLDAWTHELTLEGGTSGDVAFAGDRAICASYLGRSVRVHDLVTGELVFSVLAPREVEAVRLARPATRVAAYFAGAEPLAWTLRGAKSEGTIAELGRPRTDAPKRFQRISVAGPRDRIVLRNVDGSNHYVVLADKTSGAERHRLHGHKGLLSDAIFTKDGARVITSCRTDGTVRVWNTASGDCERVLLAEPEPDALAVSRDGSRLTVATGSGAKLFDLRTEGELRLVHPTYVYSAAISPDGHLLATQDWQSEVRLWDTQTGRLLAGRRAAYADYETMAFADDDHLCTAYRRWGVAHPLGGAGFRLIEPTPFRHLAQNDLYRGRRCRNPDGSLIAEGTATHVRILDARSGQERMRFEMSGSRTVAFSPDGNEVAAGNGAGEIKVWDVTRGELRRELVEHDGSAWSVAFTSDGQRVLAAGRDGVLRLWGRRTLELVAELRHHEYYIKGIAVSADGDQIVTVSGDRTARIWDRRPRAERVAAAERRAALRRAARRRVLALLREHAEVKAVRSAVADLDAETRAAVRVATLELGWFVDAPSRTERERREATAALLCLARARLVDEAVASRDSLDRVPESLRGWEWRWLDSMLQPDRHLEIAGANKHGVAGYRRGGTAIYAVPSGNHIRVAEVASGRELHRLACEGPANSQLSRSGRLLGAISALKQRVRLFVWDLDNGKRLQSIEMRHAGTRPWFSADERFVASDYPERFVANLETGEVTRFPTGPAQTTHEVMLSPDGSRLSDWSGVFDTASGQRVEQPFRVRQGVTWSPDGKLLAHLLPSAVELRDARTPSRVSGIAAGGCPTAVVFSGDSKRFAIKNLFDGGIRIWSVDPCRRTHELVLPLECWLPAAFHPDGNELCAWTATGVRFWSLRETPAQRESAARASESKMRPIVERLLAALEDDAAVAARIESDPSLRKNERRAALQLLFERALAARFDQLLR